MDAMMSLLPLFFMQVPMVVAVAFIAPKINQNRALWVVISIIPVIGFIAVYVFFFLWMAYITDVLNDLKQR